MIIIIDLSHFNITKFTTRWNNTQIKGIDQEITKYVNKWINKKNNNWCTNENVNHL